MDERRIERAEDKAAEAAAEAREALTVIREHVTGCDRKWEQFLDMQKEAAAGRARLYSKIEAGQRHLNGLVIAGAAGVIAGLGGLILFLGERLVK